MHAENVPCTALTVWNLGMLHVVLLIFNQGWGRSQNKAKAAKLVIDLKKLTSVPPPDGPVEDTLLSLVPKHATYASINAYTHAHTLNTHPRVFFFPVLCLSHVIACVHSRSVTFLRQSGLEKTNSNL